MKKAQKKSATRAFLVSLTLLATATTAQFVSEPAHASIIGGDLNSIIGGDLNSIVGGDLNSIIGGDLNSIVGGDRAALGAIERVDAAARTVVILGQTVSITADTKFLIGTRFVVGSLAALRTLKVGDYVALKAQSLGKQAVAIQVTKLSSMYVSGASPTFVRGPISSVNAQTGVVLVGSLKLDVTSLLGSEFDLSTLTVGTTIQFAGIQPVGRGVMLVNRGSIIGGDLNSRSIIGGDLDSRSIIGGDLNSRSIIGGDLDSRSIIGGDLNSRSIIGGDLNSRSIIGGDLNSRSIIGGDLNSRSIIGGDLNSRSIIGGDLNSRSIIGGDLNSRSIIGGDLNSRSIIGGDLNSRSIIGGDLNSIVGGDKAN